MTFLPIVGRELRVAARLRFTFWSRISAAAFALLIFGLLQSLALASRGFGFSTGQIQFAILKWMAFIFALAAGIFLTSDSVSEEKREGTLGLLFLTDLRGYDIVFGKLFSQSLRAFYALLAAFPMMALTLFAGGVTGAEFARSLVVICNTLLLSLSAGLLVSTISRDSTKAMSGTLLLLLLLVGGLPLADLALAGWDDTKFSPILSVLSPYYLFGKTGFVRAGEFWSELGLQAAVWCAFLALASIAAPRSWKEKTSATGKSRLGVSRSWRYGSARFRAVLKRKFLDQQPVLWLALRDRWLPRLTFVLAVGLILFQGFYLLVGVEEYLVGGPASYSPFRQIAAVFQFLFGFGLTFWIATQAGRIFLESVRNGALELMLVTPVTPRIIVHAQWTALWKAFLFPALCIVLLQAGTGILSLLEMNASMSRMAATAPVPIATNNSAGTNSLMTNAAPGSNVVVVSNRSAVIARSSPSGTLLVSSRNANLIGYQTFAIAIGIFTTLAGLAAVAWFGMWMGLTSQKVSIAVLKTLCFVYVLPVIAISFAQGFLLITLATSGLLLSTGGNPYIFIIISAIFSGVLNLSKDAFFILWSRKRLLNRFREAVARDWKHKIHTIATVPPLPPIGAEPPVIATAN